MKVSESAIARAVHRLSSDLPPTSDAKAFQAGCNIRALIAVGAHLAVTVNVPNAPAPFACIRLSGITSLSKCA